MTRNEIEYPLPAKAQRFIAGYLRTRDIESASRSARINRYEGRKFWADPRVRAEIQATIDMTDRKMAKAAGDSPRDGTDSELVAGDSQPNRARGDTPIARTPSHRQLPSNAQRFIKAFMRYRDLEKAALHSGFKEGAGKRLWESPPIRTEIQRLLDIIEKESPRAVAQKGS
jgi:hypothetical protein